MQEKVAEDSFIIGHLSEEINKYKEIYSWLRKSSSSQGDFSKFEKENCEK
jgi:hypothetical protein